MYEGKTNDVLIAFIGYFWAQNAIDTWSQIFGLKFPRTISVRK